MLPDGYCSEMKKDEALASFALALSTRSRCNLTVKTQVFLKMLPLPLFSRLLIDLLSRNLKNHSKSMSETPQNPSKTHFDFSSFFPALPGRVWKGSGLPDGLPKESLEASSGVPGAFKSLSFSARPLWKPPNSILGPSWTSWGSPSRLEDDARRLQDAPKRLQYTSKTPPHPPRRVQIC